MVVAGTADVLVDQDRRLGHGWCPVLTMVLQDGGDRVVGPGAEHQCASAGGIDPLGAVALDQAENAARRSGCEARVNLGEKVSPDL